MAPGESARNRQQGLQQAASMIFALVAVVPLLIFAYTLHALGAMRNTQAQISLVLALAIALLGFWIFRSMLGRMAQVVQALAAAVEQANRTRPAWSGSAAATSATAVAARPVAAPASAARASDHDIPGVGSIREIAEVARTMDSLWQREAAAHVGRRVSISVANSREPLVGTISEVSDDGIILDQADGQMAVAYSRLTGIDRLASQI
jgi:hypothetical protein